MIEITECRFFTVGNDLQDGGTLNTKTMEKSFKRSSPGSFSCVIKFSGFIHLFDIVVDPLDVEQVVHANFSPLNVVDHGEDEDRQSDLSSCQHRDFLFVCICSVNWICLS